MTATRPVRRRRAYLENLEGRLCECGLPATKVKNGHDIICARCDRIEAERRKGEAVVKPSRHYHSAYTAPAKAHIHYVRIE